MTNAIQFAPWYQIVRDAIEDCGIDQAGAIIGCVYNRVLAGRGELAANAVVDYALRLLREKGDDNAD